MWMHPAVGGELAAGHLERGGLAAAVGPEQRDDRARGHDEVDAVQHLDAAVGGPDAAQLEQRASASLGSPRRRRRVSSCAAPPAVPR